MMAQPLNSAPNCISKANNLWKIQRNEVIAVLAHTTSSVAASR